MKLTFKSVLSELFWKLSKLVA